MARSFDLRKQLKLHDNQLLKRLFKDVPAMADIAWDDLKAWDVEPVVVGWEAMGDDRRHFQVVLQDVHELSDQKGQLTLIEELGWRCPGRLKEFAALKSSADKALWAFLECQVAFDQAAIFARAESLRTGGLANRWNSLPKQPISWTPELTEALESEIRTFYWNKELRGEVCKVHHYRRAGGTDFFFAYLPDWPDKLLTAVENGGAGRSNSGALVRSRSPFSRFVLRLIGRSGERS